MMKIMINLILMETKVKSSFVKMDASRYYENLVDRPLGYFYVKTVS